MARAIEVLSSDLVEQAKAELRKISDRKVCFRLQAIISCSQHSEKQVASVLNIDRSTIWRWIKRFAQFGVDGLRDKTKGHRPSKLLPEEKERIRKWLIEGRTQKGNKVHWTLPLLLKEIYDVFGKKIGKTTLWYIVRRLGFRQKVPRPSHVKSDPVKQEAFKKNCGES